MTLIGSARIDEHGNLHGGSAGDQKQSGTPDRKGEVSMQDFYVHPKGWYIFRAKKDGHADKLAKAMKQACNNKNIGYDQYQREGILKYHTDTKTKTECDCSSLVRECVIEATGKDPGNMTTATMPSMLAKTGLFEGRRSYSSGTALYTGDILVTKTSGHTVIVVSGKDRKKTDSGSSGVEIAKPTLKKGDTSAEVKKLQKGLNHSGTKDATGNKLSVDGVFGIRTKEAVMNFQRRKGLQVDGVYGAKTQDALAKVLK